MKKRKTKNKSLTWDKVSKPPTLEEILQTLWEMGHEPYKVRNKSSSKNKGEN